MINKSRMAFENLKNKILKIFKKPIDKSLVYDIIKTGMIPNIERRLTLC